MSATGTRLPLSEAEAMAAEIITKIQGEAHIVGSIRRKKSDVGDIEILVHCDATINLDVSPGPMFLGEYETVKGGPPKRDDWRYWQMRHVATGVQVEMYRFDDDNRGCMMLIRTGPAEFSTLFVVALKRWGYCHHQGYVQNVGYEEDDRFTVRCGDEQTAFQLAGMIYIEPEKRG